MNKKDPVVAIAIMSFAFVICLELGGWNLELPLIRLVREKAADNASW